MGTRDAAPLERRPTNLYGLERRELSAFLEPFRAPAFHAAQIFRWLYAARSFGPRDWTDLPLALREEIEHNASIDPGGLEACARSSDGTIKYKANLAGGGAVESVFMVHSDRVTLCVSSQVGCALDCDFCLTGKMGFTRNLTPGEIVGQVALVQQAHDLSSRPFNVVFMGMGEPLHNYAAVTAAIRLLTDPDGFGMSRQRLTLSTAGMAPAIERLADEAVRPRLAVSLNATTDELRDRLMPINRKYPLTRLLAACTRFSAAGDRLTFEYVLLAGINDSDDDVRRLIEITRRQRARLNLIPFNPVPGRLDYRPPTRRRILQIRDALLCGSIPVSVRWSRGADARAACGQLALD